MAPAIENIIVVPLQKRAIEFAVRVDLTCPAQRFFEDDIPANVQIRLMNIFRHVAQNGEMGGISDKMFAFERGEIWTCKSKSEKRHVRMPCFRYDDRWIITHGFYKPGGESEWPEEQFTIANRIRLDKATFFL